MSTRAEIIKETAENDLFFFAKQILGYKDIEEKPHRELCEILSDNTKKQKLILMPRGSFKSTLGTISFPIWEICKNRNIRIMIASETYANARKYLNEIKTQMEHNEKLNSLFGRFKPKNSSEGSWNEYEMVVPFRTKVIKEATISAVGVDQTKVGMHADFVLMDDVVSNGNINTPEQLQKTIDFYKYMLSILEPSGRICLIGTRYHHSDLYSYIIESHRDIFDIHVKKAIQDDGTLLFPQRLTHEFLEQQRKIQGTYIWNCQYMNQAMDEDSSLLKLDNIHWFTPSDIEGKNFEFFLTIDPAFSLKKKADFTGMIVVGVDHRDHWYVFEAIRLKDRPDGIINKIFELHEMYRFSNIGLEDIGMQLVLKEALDKECRERNIYLPVKGLGNDSRQSKELRIKGLQPLFEFGRIHLQKRHKDLIRELQEFPTSSHDDLCFVAGTKIMTLFGNKNIENIKKRDIIITPFGVQRILESHPTGYKEVISRSGVTGTRNHPVFTYQYGFKPLDTLTRNDRVSRFSFKENLKWRYKKLLFTKELNITSWGRESIICLSQQQIKDERILKDFMWRFGKMLIKGKLEKASMFIIKMGIVLIIHLATWSVYRLSNTGKCLKELIGKGFLNIWKEFALLLKHGMLLLREENGIVSMPLKYGKTQKLKNLNVNGVEENLIPFRKIRDFAHADVEEQACIIEKELVYNLKVEENCVYYANSLLVSNCDALSRQIGFAFPAKDMTTKEVREKLSHEAKMDTYKDLPNKQRLIWESLELEQSGRKRRVADVWDI